MSTSTQTEAVECAPSHGHCVVFSYAAIGEQLTDERWEWTDPRALEEGGE